MGEGAPPPVCGAMEEELRAMEEERTARSAATTRRPSPFRPCAEGGLLCRRAPPAGGEDGYRRQREAAVRRCGRRERGEGREREGEDKKSDMWARCW